MKAAITAANNNEETHKLEVESWWRTWVLDCLGLEVWLSQLSEQLNTKALFTLMCGKARS